MTLKKQLLLLAIAAFVFDAVFTQKPFWANKYIWDEPDSRLIGQEVQFLKPMAYRIIEPNASRIEHQKEEIEIGRRLVFSYLYRDSERYRIEKIDPRMRFKITRTAWNRRTWYDRQFVGDMRMALLVDDNNVRSISPFFQFSASDKPEIAHLENEGRFSD